MLKTLTINLAILLCAVCFSFSIKAQTNQPGDINLSFNPSDVGFGFGDGANGGIVSAALQSDGKILIGGYFTSFNGIQINHLARLNADGSLDTTFNLGTGANGYVRDVIVQSDGKAIIGGDFDSINGISINRIARLNTDGSLDTMFHPGNGANGSLVRIILQPDGKLIIGGTFNNFNGTPVNGIARLNSDGSLDSSFNTGSGIVGYSVIGSIAIQSDGKLIVGGRFSVLNGLNEIIVARLNPNGSLDTSFILGTGTYTGWGWKSIESIALQPDGKMIIGGLFNSYNGVACNHIARLNANGSLDTSFNVGIGTDRVVKSIAIESSGKVLLGGSFDSYNGIPSYRIVRLNVDGSLDNTLVNGFNFGALGSIYSIIHQPDGKAVVMGSFTNSIVRLHQNGGRDNNFIKGNGTNQTIYSSYLQPDGKLLIGGDFTIYNGTDRGRIARLNPDGSLDSSFNPGMGADRVVFAIAYQPDGKVLIGGLFTMYNGTLIRGIARLNSNGSLDTTFNSGIGASTEIYSIALQPDGKILIGGTFICFSSNSCYKITRLNSNGSLDISFNTGTGPQGGSVEAIALQPDGRIILGGSFTSYNGTSISRISRLNPNGSLDSSFYPVSGSWTNSWISSISLQPNGKVIIGGGGGIARLNSNGSLDTVFNPDFWAFNTRTISLQPDGKMIIGGEFSNLYGMPRNRIARLNSNGSLDTSFNIGSGANYVVHTSLIQPDGKIIIAGDFTSYNGIGRNRIARIWGGNAVAGVEAEQLSNNIPFVYPNPTRAFIQVKVGKSFTYTVHSVHGILLDKGISNEPEMTLHTNTYRSGTYLLRVVTSEGISVHKFIKE